MSNNSPKFAISQIAKLFNVTHQAVHKQLKSAGIKSYKIGNKAYIDHEIAKKFFKYNFRKRKIAFQIVKGGTGKTTTMFNICCAASLYGAKVLMIDLDPQGNLTDVCGVNAENHPVMIDLIEDEIDPREAIINIMPGIDLIASRIENVVLDNKLALSKRPLHTLYDGILSDLEDNYDFIIIDCPPTMGHSVSGVTLYVDTLVVPLNPDKFSIKGLSILKSELSNLQKLYRKDIDYKVFLNRYSGNTILSDKTIQTVISNEYEEGHALSTAIKNSQELPNSIDNGESVFSNVRVSSVREDYDALARELLEINL